MAGAKPSFLQRNRRSAQRFGFRSRGKESRVSPQWRRDDAACENTTSDSFPLSSSLSTPTKVSFSSVEMAASDIRPFSGSQLFGSLTTGSAPQTTPSANSSVPPSSSASLSVNGAPVLGDAYGPVANIPTSTVSLSTDTTRAASSSGPSVDAVGGFFQTTSSGAISPSDGSVAITNPSSPAQLAGLPLFFSSTTTFSAATVFQAGGAVVSLPTSTTSASGPQVPYSSPNPTLSTADQATTPSVSLGPSAPIKGTSSLPSTTSSSAPFESVTNTGLGDSGKSEVPTPPTSLDFSSTVSFNVPTIFQGPSNTLPSTGVHPGFNTTSTGSSASAASATSNSLSRTLAHNTAGVVGVTFGAVIALVVGLLFTLFIRRRRSQKRRVSKLWISSPLLQGEDGLNDSYSPAARRRPSGRSLRPVSLQSEPSAPYDTENAPYDANDDHYDTDMWSVPTPAPAGPSNSPSPDSLSSVEFSPRSTPSTTHSPTFPTPPQSTSNSPISAKGFMRRLRRGRPSMASRGLLTTLAPVVESLYSLGPSSVAEISRPPSSQHGSVVHTPAVVSRPAPSAAPPLPWIHRRRSSGPEMTQGEWNPPATWAI